jgi:hypothetical protein
MREERCHVNYTHVVPVMLEKYSTSKKTYVCQGWISNCYWRITNMCVHRKVVYDQIRVHATIVYIKIFPALILDMK